MWRKIWLIMIEVGVLIGGVVAFAALEFRLRAVDHAKLSRLEMPPNSYRQHHQCPRIPLRSPSTVGFGTGDTAVTGLGTDGLVPFFVAAFGTAFGPGESSLKQVWVLLRLSVCVGSNVSIFLRGAQLSQSSFLQSHTISHVLPRDGFACWSCSVAYFSMIFAFFPPFGFFGAIVVTEMRCAQLMSRYAAGYGPKGPVRLDLKIFPYKKAGTFTFRISAHPKPVTVFAEPVSSTPSRNY